MRSTHLHSTAVSRGEGATSNYSPERVGILASPFRYGSEFLLFQKRSRHLCAANRSGQSRRLAVARRQVVPLAQRARSKTCAGPGADQVRSPWHSTAIEHRRVFLVILQYAFLLCIKLVVLHLTWSRLSIGKGLPQGRGGSPCFESVTKMST